MANRNYSVILLLLASSCFGQTLVQQTATSTCHITTGTSLACVLGSATTSSNMLIVLFSGPVASNISSIAGGTCASVKTSAASGTQDAEMWKCVTLTGTTTITITLALSTSGNYAAANVSEWSGMINTVDGTGSNSGASSPATTGTATTTHASDVVFAVGSFFSGSTFTSGPTNTFTALNSNDTTQLNAAYRIVTSTAGYTTGWSHGGTVIYDAVIGAIQNTPSGGTITHNLGLLGVGQ